VKTSGRTGIYPFSIAKSLLCVLGIRDPIRRAAPVNREFTISSLAPIGHGQDVKHMRNEPAGVDSIHISEIRHFLVQEFGSYSGRSMRH
jgi:hypothetical protein